MPRGGGSGSRSSGGSSSSNRSSGGRSGGSFSSGRSSSGGGSSSSSSRSSSGGFFGGGTGSSSNSSGNKVSNRKIGTPIIGGLGTFRRVSNSGGGVNQSIGGGGSGCGGCSGCSFVALGIIVVAVIIVIVIVSTQGAPNIQTVSKNEITRSTIVRKPLPDGSVKETAYFTDELGWITNQNQLLEGMKHFYKKTGVQPYLYITDTINGSHFPSEEQLNAFTHELYERLFTDEAHLLLVFFEYEERYMDRYVAGVQAKTVIDEEAADILLDYIDRYYYDTGLTDEAFFSKAFTDAANRIMTVTKSPWINVLIVFGIVVAILILFAWWSRVRRQKYLEAKRTEEMLKVPLEKFGDKEVEDLSKKYEENNSNEK